MSVTNYNVYEGLTAVNYVSIVNVAGTYNNGPLNNGVDSFLTIPSSTFMIDLVTVNIGDDVLLVNQTSANQNGIYTCIQTGGIYSFSVLQRRPDFQSVEQMRKGQYISVGGGVTGAGSIYTVVFPLPNNLGVDPINFNSSMPNLKNVTFNQNTLTNVENAGGFVFLSDLNLNLAAGLIDTRAIVIGSSEFVQVNGIFDGGSVFANESYLAINGTASSLQASCASFCELDLSFANVNQGVLSVQNLVIPAIQTATNLSNLTMQTISNNSGKTIPTMIKYSGDSTTLFSFTGATTYFTNAGTSVGSAGDPAHCNAPKVLAISTNGVAGYIPVFAQNT